jgi:hypothetical protein
LLSRWLVNLKLKSEMMGIVRRLQTSGCDFAQNSRARKAAPSKRLRAQELFRQTI